MISSIANVDQIPEGNPPIKASEMTPATNSAGAKRSPLSTRRARPAAGAGSHSVNPILGSAWTKLIQSNAMYETIYAQTTMTAGGPAPGLADARLDWPHLRAQPVIRYQSLLAAD